MNVHLTPELEQIVQSKVESGLYNSASEVIREALRQMEEKDALRALHLQSLRARMDQSLDQSKRGQGVDGDEFMHSLVDGIEAPAKRKSR
jgi:antitoxin ParD1/3/4